MILVRAPGHTSSWEKAEEQEDSCGKGRGQPLWQLTDFCNRAINLITRTPPPTQTLPTRPHCRHYILYNQSSTLWPFEGHIVITALGNSMLNKKEGTKEYIWSVYSVWRFNTSRTKSCAGIWACLVLSRFLYIYLTDTTYPHWRLAPALPPANLQTPFYWLKWWLGFAANWSIFDCVPCLLDK